MIDVNLNGLFWCCRAFGRHMIAQRSGRVPRRARAAATRCARCGSASASPSRSASPSASRCRSLERGPAAAPAGGARDGHRPGRRRRRHLHDRLDAPPRARAEGRARGRAPPTALAAGSAIALVAMAFLAVLREGFETAVFLLAAFQDADRPDRRRHRRGARRRRRGRDRLGIYRGGVRINLARFFRITGARARARRRRPARDRRSTPRTRRAGSTGSGRRRSTSRWLVEPGQRLAARCSPACSACSRSPTVGEVIVWLLYASRCCSSCSGPTAGGCAGARPPEPAHASAPTA